MTIKRGSQHILGYVPEAIYGTTPATPTLKEIPITSYRPTKGYGAVRSAQLRQHPFLANLIKGRPTQTFEIGAEIQPKNHDDIIANLLGNVWTNNKISAVDGLSGMTLEDQYPGSFRTDVGSIFNSGEFTFSATADAPMTATFSGMSIESHSGNPASISSSAVTAAPAFDPYVSGDCTAKVNGASVCISSATVRIQRTVDPYWCLGSRRAKEMVPGAVTLTGSFSMPFEDNTQVLQAEAFQDASLDLLAQSVDLTNSLEFFIPRLKRTTLGITTENRGAIVQAYDYEAYYDPTTATVLQLTRTNP